MVEKKSRQRIWQDKQHEKGLCILCQNKAEGWFCAEHKAKNRARYLKNSEGKRRRNKCSSCGKLGHNRTTCKETEQ